MPSLLEAIEHKYGGSECDDGSDDNGSISVAIFVPSRSPRACVPSLLVLNNCGIATAGGAHQVKDKCALVEELDLATNCLSEWGETLAILGAMPRLRFVNLSFNRLIGPMCGPPCPTWHQLSSLVLNATGAEWACVRSLLAAAPTLEELHLSLNGYDTVELEDDCINEKFQNDTLKKLHFNGNPVRTWAEIRKIGRAFPHLECLVLADCPVGRLEEGDEEDFRELRVLNLDGTQLNSWEEIERLAGFSRLCCLRVQGCPLWDNADYTDHERRQLLIARLPAVKTLNGGGPIDAREREDAERAFIRYYMDRAEADRPARYADLVAVHGKLDPLVNVDLRPEKRVRVTFSCGTQSETRQVDVYRTVSDLKQRLEPFAGFPASRMRLFYVDQDLRDIQGPEEMKYPHKQLYSYNIQSGDEIIIDCKQKTGKGSPAHHSAH